MHDRLMLIPNKKFVEFYSKELSLNRIIAQLVTLIGF